MNFLEIVKNSGTKPTKAEISNKYEFDLDDLAHTFNAYAIAMTSEKAVKVAQNAPIFTVDDVDMMRATKILLETGKFKPFTPPVMDTASATKQQTAQKKLEERLSAIWKTIEKENKVKTAEAAINKAEPVTVKKASAFGDTGPKAIVTTKKADSVAPSIDNLGRKIIPHHKYTIIVTE